jgi:hopanoid biosynthesis associated protein HpnK
MPARLIINADDFGLTAGVNRAVGELHRAGALSSATLMANGAAFDDAVAVARAHPGLGVGCHVVLTDGVPVSPPRSIASLLGADGKTFRPSLMDFVQAVVRGAVREDDIEREALAQIEKLQGAGIDVTHVDTHKHTHLFPVVTRPLLRLAGRCSIGAIRNPFEQSWSLALGHGNRVRRMQVKALAWFKTQFERQPQIRNGEVRTTDGTLGISATGHLDGATLREILRALPAEGVFELCCHPGYNDEALGRVTTRLRGHREVEREALIAEMAAVRMQPNAPELIHYGELGGFGALGEARRNGRERVC